MQVANLQTLQYTHFYKYGAGANPGFQTVDVTGNAKISYAKTSIKPLCVSNAGNNNCVMSFDFDHFFAGLFSQDAEYFRVQNQIAITLTIDPTSMLLTQATAGHTQYMLVTRPANAEAAQRNATLMDC